MTTLEAAVRHYEWVMYGASLCTHAILVDETGGEEQPTGRYRCVLCGGLTLRSDQCLTKVPPDVSDACLAPSF